MKTYPGPLFRFLGGMKLHRKLRAVFILATLIPVLFLNAYAYLYMRSSLFRQAEEGIASGLRQLQITADDKIRRYTQVLQYAMYDQQAVNFFGNADLTYYEVYSNLQDVYLPMLVTIREMNPEITHIGVYTDNPALRKREDKIRLLSEIRQNTQVCTALRSRNVEWSVEDDQLTGMGMMMRLNRHSPENLVYLQVPADVLLDYDPGGMQCWNLAITGGDQTLFSLSAGGLETPEAGAETGIRTADGRRLFVVRQPMQELPWSLQLVFPYDQLHIDTRPLVLMSVIVFLVCLLVMTIMSWIVTRSVTVRIRNLNDAMARVEHGTMNARPQVQPWDQDEIAEMTRHFCNMLDSLESYIDINYRNQITLQKAEMKMLQAQINPHFLYNTLSMINWMAVEHDEIEISEVLMQLSQFYRMILVLSDGEVTVRDETETIMGYLDLQARLHENAFDIHLDIHEDIMEYRMIGMVLQPIVENAIVHGLDELTERRGDLEVTGCREQDTLLFTVRDNGPGMSPEQFARSLSEESKGYGLKNVHDRLRLAYGSGYGLELDNTGSAGTCIRMRIPAQMPGRDTEGERKLAHEESMDRT